MRRKLIAIGGGDFSWNLKIHSSTCISCKSRGNLVQGSVISTGSGDAEEGLKRFYSAFAKYPCEPFHLAFFRKPRPGAIPLDAIERCLLEQDAIYVGGGNTRSMLAVWREWELDQVLRKVWQASILLGGISAGAICWFDYGATDSILRPGRSSTLRCLGFLAGSCAPHFDGERHRRLDFHTLIASGHLPPGIGIDDGAAVLFENECLTEVMASRPQATAYRVTVEAGVVVEEPLSVRYLGEPA